MTTAAVQKPASETTETITVACRALASLLGDAASPHVPERTFAPDFRAAGPAREVFQIRGARNMARDWFGPFSETRYEVHRLETAGTRVTAQVTFTGRHSGTFQGVPGTGRWVTGRGVVSLRVVKALVTEATAVLTWSSAPQLGDHA